MRSAILLSSVAVASALQPLPPVEWTHSSHGPGGGFDVAHADRNIYIQHDFASQRDQDGLTLIPPSAFEFADTFRQDLEEVTGHSWALHTVNAFPKHRSGIFLDSLDDSQEQLTYENGNPSEEGYELSVTGEQISIRGSGARGMWWGTRTLLQQLLISKNGRIPSGRVVDAPAFATRGFLLDAGRKWYSPSFLKELCTYASFFKMSEFHYHTSDNYPLNRGHNETWQDVYAQFALHPEDPELQPLVQRANETLSRADYADLESHCAQRGVTVIPEIEAPGHCLVVTKWRPELALDNKDLLNLSHPDTIPLVKQIWADFLPWFNVKEVHIGSDEYDANYADEYIDFVNEMAQFVKDTSGKKVRIWGTYEPSETRTISNEVIIQHWQYGQSDPVELANQGYEMVNSEDRWAYVSLKSDHTPILPAPYPYLFNNTRVLDFGEQEGWQWEPSLFNPFNITEQPIVKPVKGAIMAAWNDNGPDASTQLEAYYAIRDGIPTVAARSWTGSRGPRLDVSTLAESKALLTSNAVAQNLDRQVRGKSHNHGGDLVRWTSPSHTTEKIHLGYGSKGLNYTLDLDISGPFVLSSNDATLQLSDDGALTFISDGWDYPLRSVAETDGLFESGYPGRIWVNETSSSHEPVTVPLQSHIRIQTDIYGGSRVWVDGDFAGRFEVFIFGGKNTQFSWQQMAFVAPLEWVQGQITDNIKAGETLPADQLGDDVFSHLFARLKKNPDAGPIHQFLQCECTLLSVAGYDTLSTALSATLFYLSRYPRVYAKLEEEIRVCLYTLHRNQDYFPQPELFLPERWLESTSHSDVDTKHRKSLRDMAFNPFFYGPRGCIGESLAYFELRCAIALLVRKYEFRGVYGTGGEDGGMAPFGRYGRTSPDECPLYDRTTTSTCGLFLQFRPRVM